MKYALGQFNPQAYDHGRAVVEEMRRETGITSGVAYSVTVAVYVNGYLQFAGANATVRPTNEPPSRREVKDCAAGILFRMDPRGEAVMGEAGAK